MSCRGGSGTLALDGELHCFEGPDSAYYGGNVVLSVGQVRDHDVDLVESDSLQEGSERHVGLDSADGDRDLIREADWGSADHTGGDGRTSGSEAESPERDGF